MSRRWLLPVVMLLITATLMVPADAIVLRVDTQPPVYVMDDYLNMTGTVEEARANWTETSDAHFGAGSARNLTVVDGSLLLEPTLSVTMLNGGNPVLTGGTGSAWDPIILQYDVVKHNGTYYLYYSGSRSTSLADDRHIGLATSTDGISFTRHPSNPVLVSGTHWYDATNIQLPMLLVDANDTFHMYYAANHGNVGAGLQDIDVCLANSTDGSNWSVYLGNPVLRNGAPNSAWNGLEVRPQGIIYDGNVTRLCIRGDGTATLPRMGMATSPDGLSWTEDAGNPVYTPSGSDWQNGYCNYGTMEKVNGTYRIWTAGGGGPWKLGWIWSEDASTWYDSGGPFLSPAAGTIFSKTIRWPRVVDEGDHYLLYALCIDNSDVRRIGAFKAVPQGLDGTYLSRTFDAGGRVVVENVTWDASSPSGGAVDLQVRWSNDSATWAPWFPVGRGDLPVGASGRYFQYRANLTAEKDWIRISFREFTLDYRIPVVSVEVSVDGGAWQPVDGELTDWYRNVSLHDGDYDIVVRATDSMGTTVRSTLPVQVDLYPPVGNITIEEGRTFHNSSFVLLDIRAFDTHGPIQMQLSRQPGFPGASWMPLRESEIWQLLGNPEGEVTIYVRFRDAAGRVSAAYNDSIIIDQSPPVASLLIDGGAKYTKDVNVMLDLEWTDITGVVAMMVSNDPAFEGALWMDPMEAMAWTLGEGDGVQRVYARLRDVVGWTTDVSDSIILDRTAPAATLSIDDDAPFTTDRDVALDLTLHDDSPVLVKLANAGDPWPDAWRNLTTPVEVPWVLATGDDGVREVRMLVRDAAGNEVEVSDDIVLDTTPPEGTLLVNGGARFTRELLVTLALDASDATSGLDQMRVSNTDDPSGASWQSVKASLDWTLEAGDGSKTVFVQLRDRAGLVTTIDGTIILDTKPPEGGLTIGVSSGPMWNPLVDLLLDLSDEYGVADVRISASPAFPGAQWRPYAIMVPWDLGDEEGTVTVYVEARDGAGNSHIASASVVLDLVDPEVHVVIADGLEGTLEGTVEVEWGASDTLGLTAVRWSSNPLFEGTPWEPIVPEGARERAGTFEMELSGGGEHRIHVQVLDMAGRTATATDAIVHVPQRPRGELRLGDGLGWTNTTSIGVEVTWTGGHGADRFRVATSEAGLEAAQWLPLGEAGTTEVHLEGGSGERLVWAQLMGEYDIASLPFSAPIVLDQSPPVIEIVSPRRGEASEDSVRLELSVSDGLDPSPTMTYRLNGGQWQAYEGPTRLRLKEGGNLVEVEARDAAGNVATMEQEVDYDMGLNVGGSLVIVIVVVVVVIGSLLFVLHRRRAMGD